MSKVICEICSTSYEATAGKCPICGWVQKVAISEEITLDVPDIAGEDNNETLFAAQETGT